MMLNKGYGTTGWGTLYSRFLRQLSLVNKDAIVTDYSIFPLAKQTRLPFSSSMSRCRNVFHLIHVAYGVHSRLLHIMDSDFS